VLQACGSPPAEIVNRAGAAAAGSGERAVGVAVAAGGVLGYGRAADARAAMSARGTTEPERSGAGMPDSAAFFRTR